MSVTTVSSIRSIAGVGGSTTDASTGHILALKQDGTVWSWGRHDVGQLGRSGLGDTCGSTTCLFTPTQIPGLTAIRGVGRLTDTYHSLVIQ